MKLLISSVVLCGIFVEITAIGETKSVHQTAEVQQKTNASAVNVQDGQNQIVDVQETSGNAKKTYVNLEAHQDNGKEHKKIENPQVGKPPKSKNQPNAKVNANVHFHANATVAKPNAVEPQGIGNVQIEAVRVNFTEEWTKEATARLKVFAMRCAWKTKLPPDLLEKGLRHEYPNKPIFKKFIFCLTQMTGIMDNTGWPVRPDIEMKLKRAGVVNPERITQILKKCAPYNTILKNGQQFAYHLAKCLHEEEPTFNMINLDSAPNKEDKLEEYYTQCKAVINISPELVKLSQNLSASNDPSYKQFLFCLIQKFGMMDNIGQLVTTNIRRKLKRLGLCDRRVDEVMKKCVVKKESPEETAYQLAMCLKREERQINPVDVDPPPPKDWINEVKSIMKYNDYQCYKPNNMTLDLLIMYKKHNYTNDPRFKGYVLCMAQRAGIMDRNYAPVRNNIARKLKRAGYSDKDVSHFLSQCVKEKSTGEDTAYDMSLCLYTKAKGFIAVDSEWEHAIYTKMDIYRVECAESTHVTPEIVKAVQSGSYPNNPDVKNYLLCLAKKAGLMDENRKPVQNALRRRLDGSEKLSSRQVEKIIKKCAKQQKSGAETAYYMTKCLHEQDPNFYPVDSDWDKVIYKKMKRYIQECTLNMTVPVNVIDAIRDKKHLDNPILQRLLLCLTQKMGILDENSKPDKVNIKRKLMRVPGLEEDRIEKIMEKCIVDKGVAEETVSYGAKCIDLDVPNFVPID